MSYLQTCQHKMCFQITHKFLNLALSFTHTRATYDLRHYTSQPASVGYGRMYTLHTSNLLFQCTHALKMDCTRRLHLEPPFLQPPCHKDTFQQVPAPLIRYSIVSMPRKHISESGNNSNTLFHTQSVPWLMGSILCLTRWTVKGEIYFGYICCATPKSRVDFRPVSTLGTHPSRAIFGSLPKSMFSLAMGESLDCARIARYFYTTSSLKKPQADPFQCP